MKAFVHKLEEILEIGGTKRDVVFLIVSTIALIASFFCPESCPVNPAWIAIVLCGIPIICEAFIGLVTEFDIKADVLVSLALIASVIIGEYFAAGEVAVIMQLGALLEDLTVAKARSGIEKLVALTPRTARVIKGEGETIVAAADVCVGDICRVLPGETVPVDGVIVQGETSIDESVMTGESMPCDKCAGDEVRSGTINCFGAFEMRAVHVGEDSSLARMVDLVQSADASKAKIVSIADRWATWIVVIALSAAAITWLVTGEIIRAVTILVVFCPCALVLATPTAIMAAIGNVTKYGVLVREGDALERLSTVKRVMFDKTGTLTFGKPQVVAVCAAKDIDRKDLYALCAAAEVYSEHPLGKAIVESYKKENDIPLLEATDFEMIPGRGVSANVGAHGVYVGNIQMMQERGISFDGVTFNSFTFNNAAINSQTDTSLPKTIEDLESMGCSVSLVAVDNKAAGFIALADTVRPDAKRSVSALSAQGIKTTMATGDREAAAHHIAQVTCVSEVRANCFPEDKLDAIDTFEKAGENIAMVGDGVNDAPALKRAFVGIAMGGVGSDIAVDAADIVLVGDGIGVLPHLFALSKRMMVTIKCNLTFSMTLNFVAIVLAITGVMGPVVGALVHNAGSVLVITNSAFLLRWKQKHAKSAQSS